MRRAGTLALCVVALAAAGPAAPADWPCVQRFVPRLTAGSLWQGPAPSGDWHADPAIATLVMTASDRQTPIEQAEAALRQFVATKPSDEARAEVFAGLVAQSNAGRDEAVDRLHGMDRRLRALADAVKAVSADLNALPDDAPPAQRDEMTERRTLAMREYESINRTVRYACEIPPSFESRLGRFAQILRPPQP